jgi:hypothetical protein
MVRPTHIPIPSRVTVRPTHLPIPSRVTVRPTHIPIPSRVTVRPTHIPIPSRVTVRPTHIPIPSRVTVRPTHIPIPSRVTVRPTHIPIPSRVTVRPTHIPIPSRVTVRPGSCSFIVMPQATEATLRLIRTSSDLKYEIGSLLAGSHHWAAALPLPPQIPFEIHHLGSGILVFSGSASGFAASGSAVPGSAASGSVTSGSAASGSAVPGSAASGSAHPVRYTGVVDGAQTGLYVGERYSLSVRQLESNRRVTSAGITSSCCASAGIEPEGRISWHQTAGARQLESRTRLELPI